MQINRINFVTISFYKKLSFVYFKVHNRRTKQINIETFIIYFDRYSLYKCINLTRFHRTSESLMIIRGNTMTVPTNMQQLKSFIKTNR